ncbi:MAG: TrkH family potassium uptake protein [Actinomycetes bacterium]
MSTGEERRAPPRGPLERFVQRPAIRLVTSLRPRQPTQVVVLAFVVAVLVFTGLLMLPVSADDGTGTSFRVALFTATSAVCVTGLVVVDTAEHWSTFGEVVILGGVQLGGFGIMTFATLLGMLVLRRAGLRTRLLAQAETHLLDLGDITRVVRGVALVSLVFEVAVACALAVRFALGYGESIASALYSGVFYAVTAFNDAGFGLRSDNLVAYVSDPWVCLPIAVAVTAGGLGFPVLFELRREIRMPSRWSLHTRVTLLTSALLIAGGTVAITAFEWTNPQTLGPLSVPAKVLAGTFAAVTPRTAGFNSIDVGAMNETSWLVTDVLMFIGGGSGGTAGGIKVTTFMILFFAIVAEARGSRDTTAFGRRIPETTLRLALTVALIGVAVVAVGTLVLVALTGLDLDRALFEVVSAASTAGLTTGVTGDLPASAQYLLTVLMFVGRLGSVTVASALALRELRPLFRYPEERPIIG